MPAFPVDLRAWLGCLIMEQQVFDLGEGLTVQNRTAGGQVLRSGGAERLWRGSMSLRALRHEDARGLHAKMHALRGVGASFYIGDETHTGAGQAVTLATVQANGTVNLSGGPANGAINAGDYLSFNYSGGIRAFHQILSDTTFNSSGARTGIEVVPAVRPGWTAGAAAVLGKTTCLAVMVPGTLRVGSSNDIATSGASFDWVQLLRAAA